MSGTWPTKDHLRWRINLIKKLNHQRLVFKKQSSSFPEFEPARENQLDFESNVLTTRPSQLNWPRLNLPNKTWKGTWFHKSVESTKSCSLSKTNLFRCKPDPNLCGRIRVKFYSNAWTTWPSQLYWSRRDLASQTRAGEIISGKDSKKKRRFPLANESSSLQAGFKPEPANPLLRGQSMPNFVRRKLAASSVDRAASYVLTIPIHLLCFKRLKLGFLNMCV